jgi:hypothetical protein
MDTYLTVNTVTPGTLHRPPEVKSTITAQMLGLNRSADAPITTVAYAYQTVPWFRTACKLRADALMNMPLELQNEAGDDVSEEPQYQPVLLWTRAMLYRIEMNLVKYGAAYHLLETNRFGLNHTPRFIPTNSVMVQSNYVDGVTGFHISGIGTFPLKSGRVVWAWEPNDESEILPGTSDGEAGLKAAGLLYAIQEMANRYMDSGAVPITAVSVPATVDSSEYPKMEGWLTRAATGFRNAFKFLIVKKDTEFTKIGSEMKDIMAPELTATERDNVAVAMRVPPTVIDGKSANYATAESEMVGFYMNTVIPQASMLEPLLNTQLYQRLGLTLKFQPEQLDVMQAIQMMQAEGVSKLVDIVLSKDEARAVIEYDPIPGGLGEWKKEEPPVIVAPDGKPMPGQAKPMPDEDEDDAPAKMKAWLDTSLAQVKSGQPATVGAPFDDELAAASSGKMVRRIYEAHWPRVSAPPEQSLQERAVLALEKFNALAGKE